MNISTPLGNSISNEGLILNKTINTIHIMCVNLYYHSANLELSCSIRIIIYDGLFSVAVNISTSEDNAISNERLILPKMITITLTYLAFHNTPFRLLIFELFCQLEDLASFPNFAFMRTMKISICTSVQNEKKATTGVWWTNTNTLKVPVFGPWDTFKWVIQIYITCA